jgi:hypothetical protein
MEEMQRFFSSQPTSVRQDATQQGNRCRDMYPDHKMIKTGILQ